MNNCPKCGMATEPGAAFCGNCGQPLNQGAQPQPSTQAPQPMATQPVMQQPPAAAQSAQPSPFTQVINNKQPSASSMAPMGMTPAVVGASALPSYAQETAKPGARKGEIQSTIGLLCGVLAIPMALFIPLVALILGIAGVVLSTIGRSSYRHTLSLIGIIVSVIGIVAGLVVWGIVASKLISSQSGSGRSGTVTSSADLVTITTPCYSVKIDKGLRNYNPTNCNFDAASTQEEFTVDAVNNPNVTTSNLDQMAPGIFKQALSQAGETYVSGTTGTFANSPAYIVYADSSTDDSRGIFALVEHDSSSGNNLYFVAHVIRSTSQPAFGTMESNWQWK